MFIKVEANLEISGLSKSHSTPLPYIPMSEGLDLASTLSTESCATLGKLPPWELFIHISHLLVKNCIQSFHVDFRLSLCWECSSLSTINIANSVFRSLIFSNLFCGILLKYLVLKKSNKSNLPSGSGNYVLMRMVSSTQNYF